MKLFGNVVLIRPDSNPPRTKGGVLLSPLAMEKYVKRKSQPGTITDCGPLCENVEKGTRCLFPVRNASVIVIEDVEYYLITEDRLTYIAAKGEKL